MNIEQINRIKEMVTRDLKTIIPKTYNQHEQLINTVIDTTINYSLIVIKKDVLDIIENFRIGEQ